VRALTARLKRLLATGYWLLATGNWQLIPDENERLIVPIWSFLAVTVPLVLTPGASTAVVLRNSLSGGVRAGVETAAGVNSGSVVYGLISAFGLALALRSWPAVWTALRVGGGLYLLWLALRSLHAAFAPQHARVIVQGDDAPRRLFRNLKEGFLTNLLNPSIASF
jgi:threonine/homoserine/homoserine lactone efflux protein